LRRLKTPGTAECFGAGAFETNTLQHPRENRYLLVLSMIAARGMPPEIFPGNGAPHKALRRESSAHFGQKFEARGTKRKRLGVNVPRATNSEYTNLEASIAIRKTEQSRGNNEISYV
jgi:hypothetical protein